MQAQSSTCAGVFSQQGNVQACVDQFDCQQYQENEEVIFELGGLIGILLIIFMVGCGIGICVLCICARKGVCSRYGISKTPEEDLEKQSVKDELERLKNLRDDPESADVQGPIIPLKLVFRDQDGSEKKYAFDFKEAPLGVGYKKGKKLATDGDKHIFINKVVPGSEAQRLGKELLGMPATCDDAEIEKRMIGMQLLEVDGENIENDSRTVAERKLWEAVKRHKPGDLVKAALEEKLDKAIGESDVDEIAFLLLSMDDSHKLRMKMLAALFQVDGGEKPEEDEATIISQANNYVAGYQAKPLALRIVEIPVDDTEKFRTLKEQNELLEKRLKEEMDKNVAPSAGGWCFL
jgi:hypothetical protein